MDKANIFVTRPSLPPLDEFLPYLSRIWDSKHLTNQGPFHNELETVLAEFLGVGYVSLFNNGTLALFTALRAAGISGEVITTPFSFVATSNAIVLAGATPVFVDVDPATLNIDPEKIEAAITSRTTAILPVHCYGNSCDTNAIQQIAQRHGLKIIYDAAHAFGVPGENGSLLNAGEMSVLSFHATKVFNTFEGGAVVCRDTATKTRIDELRNFGLVDGVQVSEVGLNGKMSEFNAAFGLLQLKYVHKEIAQRREVASRYAKRLAKINGLAFPYSINGPSNGSYFPILVTDDFGMSRDQMMDALKVEGIICRKYFFPLISNLKAFESFARSDVNPLPAATRAANQVICLPIYADLPMETVDRICDVISAASV